MVSLQKFSIDSKEKEYCRYTFDCKADQNLVKNTRWDLAADIKKNATVPGFRRGKATAASVVKYFKKQIDEQVKAKLFNEAQEYALYEFKRKNIGQAIFNSASLKDDQFNCSFDMVFKPEFTLGEYKGLEIPKPDLGETESDLAAKIMQSLREENSEQEFLTEDEQVTKGNVVTLDFELLNGNKKQTIKSYKLGSNNVSDFDDNIYGMKLGETREFAVNVNDQKVDCKVTLTIAARLIPAALDDALAKRLGMETLAELETAVTGKASSILEQKHFEAVAEQVKRRLISTHDFKVPEWFETMEAQNIALQSGNSWDNLIEVQKEILLDRARDSVRLSFILDSISEVEKDTEVSDQEALEGVARFLISQGVKDVKGYITNNSNNGKIHYLVAKYKQDYTVKWLVDNAKIVE